MALVNMGRTARIRGKRQKIQVHKGLHHSNEATYIEFMQWSKGKGLQMKQLTLKPAHFHGKLIQLSPYKFGHHLRHLIWLKTLTKH